MFVIDTIVEEFIEPSDDADTPPDQPDDDPASDDSSADRDEPTATAPETTPDFEEDEDIYDPLTETVPFYRSGGDDGFNLDLTFEGDWTLDEQNAVIKCAEFISQVIVEDIPDDSYRGQEIDDVAITLSKADIDSYSGILAYAQVYDTRSDSDLPTRADIVMDNADLEALKRGDDFESTVLHEMFHAIGFGIKWEQQGLIDRSNPDAGVRFTGANATQAYLDSPLSEDDPFAASGVPVDPRGGHWDEGALGSEFMTGILNANSFVSDITLASLDDMGYDTVRDDVTKPNDAIGPAPTMFV